MMQELRTNYNSVYEKLLQAKNVEEATYVFATRYERPKGSRKKVSGKYKRVPFETARNQSWLKERLEAAEQFA